MLKVVKLILLVFVTCAAAHPCLPQAQRPAPAQTAIPPEDRIDINHASIEQLMKIPGMTCIWAGRIVRFRPYRAKNELINRGIIPGEIYDRIKDSIVAHRESH